MKNESKKVAAIKKQIKAENARHKAKIAELKEKLAIEQRETSY